VSNTWACIIATSCVANCTWQVNFNPRWHMLRSHTLDGQAHNLQSSKLHTCYMNFMENKFYFRLNVCNVEFDIIRHILHCTVASCPVRYLLFGSRSMALTDDALTSFRHTLVFYTRAICGTVHRTPPKTLSVNFCQPATTTK
jgi:hypothetical protein